VALVLGAVWAALDERRGWVLGLGTAAALLRPEVWPFLAVWAWFATRGHPRLRATAIAAAILVPLAWFVPDIIGAGTPLEGGETARAGGIEPLDGLAVMGRALTAPLAAAWVGVALLLWRGAFVNPWFAKAPHAGRDRPLAILLAGAGAWIALVALMAVAGFAGLPRFLAPATAMVAVLGGVGIARAAAPELSPPDLRAPQGVQRSGGPLSQVLRALVGLVLVLAVGGFGWRLAQLPGDLEVVERQANSIEHLFDLVDKTGGAELLACQGQVRMTRVREQTALAWKLDEPIAAVPIRHRPRYGVALSNKRLPGGDVIAHAGGWRATRFPCPAGEP